MSGHALKVALIGVGHLGAFHAEKLFHLPEVASLYLVDLREDRLKAIQEKLKSKGHKDIIIERNYGKILSEIDAVVVATPTLTHYEIAKEVLLAEKPLFLEKPPATTLGEAEELVELAERKKLPFQVGFIERFQRAVKELLREVKRPLFIEAHRLSGFVERNLDIDVVLDLMIHDLDLVFLLKKEVEVEYLHAVGAPVFTDKPDIVNARLVFKDGTTCNLTASRISLSKQRKFRVFERGAYYSVDTLEKSFLVIKPQPEKRDFSMDKKTFPEDDPLREELKSFLQAVIGKEEVQVTGKEALVSLDFALKIREEALNNLKRSL